MNLNHLEYFLEIVNCSSITKASKKLYLSPTTLVAAVNALEDELGYKLLVRSHNGTTPTAAGRVIYEDILEIFKTKESWFFLDKIGGVAESATIKVVPSIYESVYPKLSVDMLEKYPDVFLDAAPLYSRNFEKEFYENNLKLYLGSYHKSDKGAIELFAQNLHLNLDVLFEDEYLVYYGAQNEYFQGKGSIMLAEYNSFERITFLSQKTFECEISKFFSRLMPMYSFEQMFEYIATHNCVTVLPSILKNNLHCSSGQILTCPFSDNHTKIWFFLLSHQEDKLSPAEKKARDYFRERAQNYHQDSIM